MQPNELIQRAGYRLTSPRRTVLTAITNTPLSVQELFIKLSKVPNAPDLATIYRNVEVLSQIGLISKVQFQDGVTRYELVSESNHHHHLICDTCGKIEDISVNEEKIISQITKKSAFKITSHQLEFFGICENCQ